MGDAPRRAESGALLRACFLIFPLLSPFRCQRTREERRGEETRARGEFPSFFLFLGKGKETAGGFLFFRPRVLSLYVLFSFSPSLSEKAF